MKIIYDELFDVQILCSERLEREKELKKSTKLAAVIKKVFGDVSNRLKGTLHYIVDDLEEQREEIRLRHCSTDKDGNILRSYTTQTDKTGASIVQDNGGYKFTPEKEKVCVRELKNINKKSITIDEKDLRMVTELPADLTEGEQELFVGWFFTEETLHAWKQANNIETNLEATD